MLNYENKPQEIHFHTIENEKEFIVNLGTYAPDNIHVQKIPIAELIWNYITNLKHNRHWSSSQYNELLDHTFNTHHDKLFSQGE